VTRNDYRQYWDRATAGAPDLEKPHGGGTRHLGYVVAIGLNHGQLPRRATPLML
jgi:hypothetical protein